MQEQNKISNLSSFDKQLKTALQYNQDKEDGSKKVTIGTLKKE